MSYGIRMVHRELFARYDQACIVNEGVTYIAAEAHCGWGNIYV
jgi:hypothetical protein